MKRSLLVAALLTATSIRPASAQFVNPPYVGIPTANFNFAASAQQQDEWCWAASVQMILNWYGVPVSQQMVVARTHMVITDQGGSDRDISNALTGWALTANGRPVSITSWMAAGPPAPTVLVNELSAGHPILLTFATGAYSGHVVVITAANYTPTPNGPQINSLVIRDPWPSQQNIATSGRVEIGGMNVAQFLPLIRSHWLVSIH